MDHGAEEVVSPVHAPFAQCEGALPRGGSDATAEGKAREDEVAADEARDRALTFALLLVAAPALASFPGSNPSESVRINTPNDPGFDHCEPDDEQGPPTCSNAFGEQYERFGFAPNGSQHDRALPQPARPARAALLGAEHGRRPQPARPGARRLGGPRLEVLDRQPERADRDPRHRHPLGQDLAPQARRAEQGRAAASAQRREHVQRVRLQRRRRIQRRRLRERPARVAQLAGTTTSRARTRSSTRAT